MAFFHSLLVVCLLVLSLPAISDQKSPMRCHPNDKKVLFQIKTALNNPYDLASWIKKALSLPPVFELEEEKEKMAGGSFAAASGVGKDRANKYQGRVTPYVITAYLVAAVGGSIFGYNIGVSGANHHDKPSCCFGEKRNNRLPLWLLRKPAFQSWSMSSYLYRFLLVLISFSMMPVVVLGQRDATGNPEPSLGESLDVLYVFLGLAVAMFGSVGIYFLWKKYSQRPRLVSSDVFDTYPIHVFVGSSQVVECFICTEAYILGDIICTIPCGHAFHVHHIREWLTKSAPTCPTCHVSHT